MQDKNILELLEIYTDLIDKQDEVIKALNEVCIKQATELRLIKNDMEYSKAEDINDILAEYEKTKSKGL